MSKKNIHDVRKPKQKSRRYFLGVLAGLAGSTLGVLSQKNGPVELPLHEADFYKHHNLAG